MSDFSKLLSDFCLIAHLRGVLDPCFIVHDGHIIHHLVVLVIMMILKNLSVVYECCI